jgi:hypothetical protein
VLDLADADQASGWGAFVTRRGDLRDGGRLHGVELHFC